MGETTVLARTGSVPHQATYPVYLAAPFQYVSVPYRIFLVEDHAVMRTALSMLIGREEDLDLCGMAASAEEALDGDTMAGCDLLLTDVSLPGMDGIALAERVRADRPGFPVVVVSAFVDETTVQRAEAAGARAYLSKNELGATLAPTLREVLHDNEARRSAA